MIEDSELIVDSFAGGGGASLGITWALGRSPDVAINHDADAIAMHAANHPGTLHCTEDVFKVNPRKVTRGRPVGLLWASPDCRHFSRAKGGKPVEKSIRGLAWVVVKWATEVRPRVIILENVREFQDWGPLLPRWDCPGCRWKGTEGQVRLARRRPACPACDSTKVRPTEFMVPDPARKGVTFKQFVGRLRGQGYAVEWQVLNAADYGAPTHRRRLFLVARNDGEPIAWPEPTHGDPKKIGRDLFSGDLLPWRTAAGCIDWSVPCPSIFDRKKPLAEKTMKRIAMGVKRYVLDNPRPFIVTVNHGRDEFRGRSIEEPFATVTGSRGDAVVTPFVARLSQSGGNGSYTNGVGEPLTTVVSKNEHLLIAPTLVQTGYGERKGQAPRALDLNAPLGTVVGTPKHALVAAFVAKHFGGVVGVPADVPLPTTTARGTQNQLAAVNLVHMNHGDKQWSGADEPMRTVTSGNHAALVYSFLVKYFGTAVGQHVAEPLHTVTGKDRFGLVTVQIDGEPYVVTDIGMRMLKPRELARAQSFPDAYLLTGSATHQVARIGNSVPPVLARAIAAVNLGRVPQVAT
ncbi:dna methyltransferase : C-5 cytosine-specific DNA methylase OS=Paenibacillus sp. P22 GN=BN871_EA_00080 PE=3 SV=1: DNA_methylase: DNA_methylase: DNA_methylase [Gemmataceae bacterium]|nr:dna methyltransferase : C-5 cytosine-specific DNA methylase OS=Paenibacillus sp. P22 GN=BN871_EA_00080 PE=3 SV=1: DNA_methylase: DNA_methylase: DNA_methylase [Gemmataceae bacterium]VTT98910.1 dna methyltransferase : C-5 cytosine-specific DNA methylase OS=Paenibacillus sp. P22 GN=BN871_EA_00080 PE=3 SV=1: DNA_methylase: DNA_methylase: DNA_methylase [Gemmataceae bacterium]